MRTSSSVRFVCGDLSAAVTGEIQPCHVVNSQFAFSVPGHVMNKSCLSGIDGSDSCKDKYNKLNGKVVSTCYVTCSFACEY